MKAPSESLFNTEDFTCRETIPGGLLHQSTERNWEKPARWIREVRLGHYIETDVVAGIYNVHVFARKSTNANARRVFAGTVQDTAGAFRRLTPGALLYCADERCGKGFGIKGVMSSSRQTMCFLIFQPCAVFTSVSS